MSDMTRRGFLGTGGGIAAGLALSGPAAARTASTVPHPEGTTLESVATPTGASGYRRLAAGPGWPVVTRTELADARAGRADRRTPLAGFVQLTDLHVVDAQSPARFEYLHPYQPPAFRPHETLASQGATSLVRRVNAITATPHTGRTPDFVVCTGDSSDNHEHVELDWYLTVLSGGTVTPNTGDPARYEGVQNSGMELYWNPERSLRDRYKQQGFPRIPGLLGAATARFDSPGLAVPWYAVFGNHDDSVEGTLPSGIPPLDTLYTGALKVQGLESPEQARRLAAAIEKDPRGAAYQLPPRGGLVRVVTPDARRTPFTPKEFVAAHLDDDRTGAGPAGHGFGEDNLDADTGYYTFEMAPGVVGISMDSTNRAGFVDGSVGTKQLRWLERTLAAGSSRYFDADGTVVRHQVSDTYFVLLSHHTSTTMDNLVPDPARPLEKRHSGAEIVELAHRFPNLLAWVNGHTHRNEISPRPGPAPERGFWEINTASHTEFPQHARIVEVADNGDGTLSLLCTLIEADAPYAADYGDTSGRGLASLYRELAFNDIHADPAKLGAAKDHNTELLLVSPAR